MTNLTEAKNYDVGVIVGRFQVPQLHDGHRALIDHVANRHRKLLIVLGTSPTQNTIQNPLDFEARRQMLTAEYPNAIIMYLKDVNSDALWSKNLDGIVGDITSPTQTAVLYGSRDSFIRHYTGRYDTIELTQDQYYSGTEIRDMVRQETRTSEDFRAGVIWASANRYPVVYSTVDVAILNQERTQILLGRKAGVAEYRLIGGFADPSSDSFERDAYREVGEETHLALLFELEYLGSFNIDDWRYRNEPDMIRTHLYIGIAENLNQAKADDDIVEVKVFDIEKLRTTYTKIVVPEHQELIERVLNNG